MLKVLTYVNGKLTVIRGDSAVLETVAEKPSFITSMSFYFEPTQKVAIDANGTRRDLDENEQASSLAFIDAYLFSTPAPVEVELRTHNVNAKGVYLGYGIKEDQDIAVATAPLDSLKFYWDFNISSWVEGYSVDLEGKLISIGILTSEENLYIPKSLIREDLCTLCQTYDFNSKTMIINLTVVKEQKTSSLYKSMNDEIMSAVGDFKLVGAYEIPSYAFQVQEANSYLENSAAPTPFLDALIVARAVPNETKDNLILKILEKEAAYATFYGALLGRFQNRVKQVAAATSVDEVKYVIW